MKFYLLLGFSLLSFFFFNCTRTIGEQLNSRISDPFDITKNIPVYFVTNRRVLNVNDPCSQGSFGFLTDTKLSYGSCLVSVPGAHVVGDISIDNEKNQNLYFQLKGKTTLTKEDYLNEIQKSNFDEVLVFVHGFNVNFDEAVVRSSQIKYDLKFPGPILLYSWPAGAPESVLNSLLLKSTYDSNLGEAQISRDLFLNFFKEIGSLGKKIHLIVHSMGHQIVLPSLAQLSNQSGSPKIRELILNAPDFDKREFELILPNLKKISERITLYCSPGDNALIASQKVNGGVRAGMCFRFDGIDVINVNEVDSPVLGIGGLGHGYYSSRPILTDMYQVLLGVSAEKRLFVRKSGPKNGEHFVLRK